MTRLAKTLRSHRDFYRTRRTLAAAIQHASTPALRDELIMIAQRADTRIV